MEALERENKRLWEECKALRHMLRLLVDDIDSLGGLLPTTIRRARELAEKLDE